MDVDGNCGYVLCLCRNAGVRLFGLSGGGGLHLDPTWGSAPLPGLVFFKKENKNKKFTKNSV